MSGIAVSYGSSDEADLRRMLAKLEHRGEMSGIVRKQDIALGYRSNCLNGAASPGDVETFSSNGETSTTGFSPMNRKRLRTPAS